MKTETVKLSQVQVNEANPRTITNEKFQKLVNSVLALPKMLELRPIVVDNMMVAKTHQHLLVFFKGDPKKIKKEFPKIEYTEEDLSKTESGETGSESETE